MIGSHRRPRRSPTRSRSRQHAKVKAAIAAIDDDDWQAIAYTRGGRGPGVVETTITAGRRGDKLRGDDGAATRSCGSSPPTAPACSAPQGELWPNWR